MLQDLQTYRMELLTKTLFLCLAVLAIDATKLKFEPKAKQPKSSANKEQSGPYFPNWDSIDSRPLPEWYDEAKFGIFIHWGVYSVPAFQTEWFWRRWKDGIPSFVLFMAKNYPPRFQYPDFAPLFTAEMFDANHFADVLKASGAQ
ncbi:Plasma alpha-L-fucosidase [Holothuria leucospilota]|uniref:alpha-L-fucosidase n=1 Tax=Holothuria leucospilota TaxID=206669 RepID=A0A9Q1C4K3_HOLLE|nr:Plasma alpha-L-fucosidase [Holothuria leucospilota]